MPTYTNSGEVTYRINDINDVVQNIGPGENIQTYDRNVPGDFILQNDLPSLQRIIHSGSGEYVYTGTIIPKGYFNVSVSGEFTGTVRLERSFDGFESIIKTMDTFTISLEDHYNDTDPNASYRLGVRAGELESGSVEVILSKDSQTMTD